MVNEKTVETRKIVGVSAELAQRIKDFRHQAQIPTEAAAIRLLIEEGLKARGFK